MIIFFISAAVLAALFLAYFPFYKPAKEGLLVLTYHNVGVPPKNCRQKHLWVSPQKLQKQLDMLKKNGFTFVKAQDVLAGNLPPKAVLLSFDNGYQNFYTHAADILKANNAHAIVFLTVQYIGTCNFWHDTKKGPWQPMLSAQQVEELLNSGNVAFGSKTLTNAKLTMLETEERDNQIAESAHRLHTIYKIAPQFFAYPYSAGFDNEEIKNKVSSVYALQFADTGAINPLPLEASAVINRVQVNGRWCALKFYTKISGR